MFKIVSWYTPEYQKVLNQYLYPSLKAIDGIDYQMYAINSNKNWKKNTNLKPIVAEQALKETTKDILLVDADCKVNEYPILFDEIPEEYDVAMFYLNWNEWYQNASDKVELCSGTLFFKNRSICYDLIEAWKIEASKESNELPDQVVLADVLKDFPRLNIYLLPYEYCWINSMPRGGLPFVQRPDKVYIEHFQVSRELRNKIR